MVNSISKSNEKRYLDTKSHDGAAKQRSAGVKISQNLFHGFSDVAQVEKEKHKITAEKYSVEDSNAQVLLKAVKAYTDLFCKQRILELRSQYKNQTQAEFENAQKSNKAGEVSLPRVLEAQTRLNDAKMQEAQAIGEREAAQAQFMEITGINTPTNLSISLANLQPIGSLADLQNHALEHSPTLSSAASHIKELQQEKNAATGQLLPSVDVSVSGNVNRKVGGAKDLYAYKNANKEAKAELSISVPLYDRGMTYSKRRAAMKATVAAKTHLEHSKRQLQLVCAQVYSRYIAAQQSHILLKQNTDTLLSLVKAVRAEYSAGSKTLTDVKKEELKLLECRIKMYNNAKTQLDTHYQLQTLKGEI